VCVPSINWCVDVGLRSVDAFDSSPDCTVHIVLFFYVDTYQVGHWSGWCLFFMFFIDLTFVLKVYWCVDRFVVVSNDPLALCGYLRYGCCRPCDVQLGCILDIVYCLLRFYFEV
jgi:hypothetical protein